MLIYFFDLVVESTSSQSFVTRQLIKKTSRLSRHTLRDTMEKFPNHLKNRLQDHYLYFDRSSMNMKALEIFVKYGLMENEFLNPYDNALTDAKQQVEKRKKRAKEDINKDIEIIKVIALKELKKSYR